MEWVETTGKSVAEAKDLALDRLGVAADDAEFEVLEEPKAGLFGRVRGEARVRARVKPSPVRPKIDRRNRGRSRKAESGQADDSVDSPNVDTAEDSSDPGRAKQGGRQRSPRAGSASRKPQEQPADRSADKRSSVATGRSGKDMKMNDHELSNEAVDVEAVGAAAADFMTGLVEAFGTSGATSVQIEGTEIEVSVEGDGLGLLVGHGGRTLSAVQDLTRVAAQRRLGDHETRLRVDVGGYRAKRRVALERFALTVADDVKASGRAKALEPMQSADRKIVHDVLSSVDGVTSSSQGDDPMRRVVISPS